jgi:hypothetical protein
LRRDILATTKLLAEIDETAALLNEAQSRNFVRWPTLGEYIPELDHVNWPGWKDRDTYQKEVDWMKTWLNSRLDWIDDAVASEYAMVPPEFNQQGGLITSGFELIISHGGRGTIYYTLDGTDPYTLNRRSQEAGSIILVAGDAAKTILVPYAAVPGSDAWRSNPNFDDFGWNDGAPVLGNGGGVGYEVSSGYHNFFSYDVEAEMYGAGKATSCYVRMVFTVDEGDLDGFNALTLRMRYDDGFVAYLDGVEVARENAPALLDWASAATSDGHEASQVVDEYDITGHLEDLTPGEHVLAIHGLNSNTSSSDFLVWAELLAAKVTHGGSVIAYTGPITLSGATHVRARPLHGSTWGALNEATFYFDNLREDLCVTKLMYHPAENGAEFIEFQNCGSEVIDLAGVHFTDGITFTFVAGTLLDPGQYIVLVRDDDASAFAALYPGVPLGGLYTGGLSNGGERLELSYVGGDPIIAFTYDDEPPWPTGADGDGFSLVPVDPKGDLNSSDNWRLSDINGAGPHEIHSANTN